MINNLMICVFSSGRSFNASPKRPLFNSPDTGISISVQLCGICTIDDVQARSNCRGNQYTSFANNMFFNKYPQRRIRNLSTRSRNSKRPGRIFFSHQHISTLGTYRSKQLTPKPVSASSNPKNSNPPQHLRSVHRPPKGAYQPTPSPLSPRQNSV